MKNCFFGILSFLFIVVGCHTSRQISNQNLVNIYRPESFFFNAKFSIFHFNEDSSRIYLKIDNKDFLYTREYDGDYTASVNISYRLFPSYESRQLLDSVSFVFTDESTGDVLDDKRLHKKLIYHFDIRDTLRYALAEVIITDQKRRQSDRYFIELFKADKKGAQYFLITQADNDIPLFTSCIESDQRIRIRYRDTSTTRLYVRYYKRNFPLALPPFSLEKPKIFGYDADSIFTIDTHKSGDIVFSEEGFYHMQPDTLTRKGITLFLFREDFPELTSPTALIESLRYLTNRKEYDEIINSPYNKKDVLDEYWLGIAGNSDRARELIRKYYSRVQHANIFFTSYLEGWKTDRGLIYIIFGIPNTIYKTSYAENWIYGEIGNPMSVIFTFNRVENPFTENDYVLTRSPSFEAPWYRAVEMWRQGRVFNDN